MLRWATKLFVFAIAMVIVMPLVALTWIEKKTGGFEAVFNTCAQLLALVPGPIGRLLRAGYYFGTLDSCSWQVHIGFGSLFTHRGARISRNVSMGSYCVIGHAEIASGARMASRISIPSGKRQHLDDGGNVTDDTIFDRVSIGSDAWVGEAATILADVGDRVIVSAGAVVIKPVPSDHVVGGNPAKVIRALATPEAEVMVD